MITTLMALNNAMESPAEAQRRGVAHSARLQMVAQQEVGEGCGGLFAVTDAVWATPRYPFKSFSNWTKEHLRCTTS